MGIASAIIVLTAGCNGPLLVTGDGLLGVGLYGAEERALSEQVRYRRVRGLGVLFDNGSLTLGFSDRRTLAAQVEGASYTITSPPMTPDGRVVVLAVGDEALEAAAGFDEWLGARAHEPSAPGPTDTNEAAASSTTQEDSP